MSFDLFNVMWWRELKRTPSGLVKEDVLDKIWVKHWEYKSWITSKLLSLEMWKLYVSVRNVVPTLTSSKRRGLSLNGRC
jgi:hypothetical protein